MGDRRQYKNLDSLEGVEVVVGSLYQEVVKEASYVIKSFICIAYIYEN